MLKRGHASNAFLVETFRSIIRGFHLNQLIKQPEIEWMNTGCTKITLQVDSEQELVDLYQKAQDKGLTAFLITDAGKTEFDGVPTKTALAIGQDKEELIDPITQHLKLY